MFTDKTTYSKQPTISEATVKQATNALFRKKRRHTTNRNIKYVGRVEIPPPQRQERKSKYQFEKLDVGESIETRYSRRNQINILTAAKIWAQRKGNGATFVTQKAGTKLYLTRKS